MHERGAFFILTCDLPTATIPPILAELGRDVDVLKKNFVAVSAGPADPPGKLNLDLSTEIKNQFKSSYSTSLDTKLMFVLLGLSDSCKKLYK